MINIFILFFALFLSAVPVMVILLSRNAVLQQRQSVITALLKSLTNKRVGPERFDALPSFEFVKFKYFIETIGNGAVTNPARDFKKWHWFVSAIPLTIILFLLSDLTLHTIARKADGNYSDPHFWFFFNENSHAQWIVVAGFAAAHLNIFSNLYRAVNNFDLSPASFIESTIDCLLGLIAGLLVYYCSSILFPLGFFSGSGLLSDVSGKSQFFLLVLFAFAAGYYPDVVKRNLVRAARLSAYKEEDVGLFKAYEITPIEIIDGIDSSIRRRLEDFHINCVQNLAAANPLMLYVETPYGVYQILDWVAQAQLISTFGTAKTKELWSFGIRSIFDLERVTRDPLCQDPDFIRAIGNILFPGLQSVINQGAMTQSSIIAGVNNVLETSHIHRLRQIVMVLSDAIGDEYRRLPFIDNRRKMYCDCEAARSKPSRPTGGGNETTKNPRSSTDESKESELI